MQNDRDNRSVLVIGANGGLAKATIKCLIEDGFKEITMACRTKSKGIKARDEILASIKNKASLNLTVFDGFDMNNPIGIENAVRSLPPTQPFDIVFLAAGNPVFSNDFQSIEWQGQKIEKNLFQNMFGSHIAFANLKKYDLLSKHARIVLSGGEGARGIPGMIQSPTFTSAEDLRNYAFVNHKMKYDAMAALGASKFFGALWTMKVAEIEDDLEVIWFSPGLTYGTEGLKNLSKIKRWVMGNIMSRILGPLGIAQSPAAGGRKFADCLSGKIGKNGGLIGAPKGKAVGKLTDQKSMNPGFENKELIEEFWKITENLFGKLSSLSYK